jgi:AraC-like DNA-binding protein
MSRSVLYSFDDMPQFESVVRAANAKVVAADRGAFAAGLMQVDFDRLWLQSAAHSLPLTAHVSVPTDRAPIFFLASADQATMQHSGADFGPHEILVWGLDSSHYQRFPANVHWASMSLSPADLGPAADALIGRPMERPEKSRIQRPSAEPFARLRDLHAQARRLARENPATLLHPEIGRAMESLLVQAMLNCLKHGGDVEADSGAKVRHRIMTRFEEFLVSNSGRSIYLTEICRAVGASESTLRRVCQEHLGMGPNRFLLLRRLHLARRELNRADQSVNTVTEIATGLGFWELGRFAAAYRAQFGETPLATLKRRPEEPKRTMARWPLEV